MREQLKESNRSKRELQQQYDELQAEKESLDAEVERLNKLYEKYKDLSDAEIETRLAEEKLKTAEAEQEADKLRKAAEAEKEAEKQKQLEDERSKAQNMDFKEICRYPDKYKNLPITIKGKVLQSLEEDGEFTLRVAENNDYDRVYMVFYTQPSDQTARILEDDMIKVYGTYGGLYDYTSTTGNPVTVPLIISTDVTIQ